MGLRQRRGDGDSSLHPGTPPRCSSSGFSHPRAGRSRQRASCSRRTGRRAPGPGRPGSWLSLRFLSRTTGGWDLRRKAPSPERGQEAASCELGVLLCRERVVVRALSVCACVCVCA
ncbi:rCG63018, partial [Rattus norvegicus]